MWLVQNQNQPAMNADMVKALAANIAVPTVEAWDPATSSWTTLPPMATARRNAAVGLLPDGRVIVAGGCTPNQGLRTQQLAQPQAGGAGAGAGGGGAAAQGQQGGADQLSVPQPIALRSVEIFDPKKNRWSTSHLTLNKPRAFCKGLVLPDGSFGVVGGGIYEVSFPFASLCDGFFYRGFSLVP